MCKAAGNKKENEKIENKEIINYLELKKNVLLGQSEKYGLWGKVVETLKCEAKIDLLNEIIKAIKEGKYDY